MSNQEIIALIKKAQKKEKLTRQEIDFLKSNGYVSFKQVVNMEDGFPLYFSAVLLEDALDLIGE